MYVELKRLRLVQRLLLLVALFFLFAAFWQWRMAGDVFLLFYPKVHRSSYVHVKPFTTTSLFALDKKASAHLS